MVSEIGFSDVLSLAQTIGIVGTLVLTLYFSEAYTQPFDWPTNQGPQRLGSKISQDGRDHNGGSFCRKRDR